MYHDFVDSYKKPCSIQKSSSAMEEAIWMGCSLPEPKMLVPGKGWVDLKMPSEAVEWIFNNRMHLTREQVRSLLPILQKFVDTGELSDE
jgi:hypothetical protein